VLKNNANEEETQMAIQDASVVGVGDLLPAITLPKLGGGEVRLDTLRGKRRLLFMWGSW
jgi:hypothetical protein